MRLFKFVGSKSAVMNRAKGSLKFTPLDELNDPSELTPAMDRAAARWRAQLSERKSSRQWPLTNRIAESHWPAERRGDPELPV